VVELANFNVFSFLFFEINVLEKRLCVAKKRFTAKPDDYNSFLQ